MVNKTHTIAKAIGQSSRKQQIYAQGRKAHTESCIVKTSKPRKSKPKKKEIAGLKNRVESIEGSEPVESILRASGMLEGEKTIYSSPEVEFAMDTAGMPKQGFQGA